mgnify:FL=1
MKYASRMGQNLIAFVRDANEKAVYPAGRFLGVDTTDGDQMQIFFEKEDGALNAAIVTIDHTDADGVGHKRVCQALANAMAPNKAGTYVTFANDLTKEFIHSDITAIASIA